ncbi:MAG: serine/threonine-protein kinase [Acidobacteriota bacterium]
MEPERWRQLKEIFQGALELPPGGRAAFLAEATAGDADQRRRVLDLLAAHESAGDAFEVGARELIAEVGRDLMTAVPGLQIGPYRIVRELGRGGMAAVYLARRDEGGFAQQVAIKLVKRGIDTDEILRRFGHERQILAGLAHPNIARLLDGGSTVDGRPYFVLEQIEGVPITRWCRDRRIGVDARVRLFLAVCAGVAHAHRSLVVHRDLKPSNILVGEDGVPKVIDFGIAKLLGAEDPGATLPGRQPLTPDYASPEQVAGGAITTATDVYGLGILLYELLAGRDPAAASRALEASSPIALPRAAREFRDDLAPAERVRLAKTLAGDLEAIVGKALETEPARRYGTVDELAADLERHLDRRPVVARRPTLAYRLGRAVRRRKGATVGALSILGLVVVALVQGYAAARARDRAESELRRAAALSGFLTDIFAIADPGQSRGEAVTAREILDRGSELLSAPPARVPRWLPANLRALSRQPETRADLLHAIGTVYRDLGALKAARSNLLASLATRPRSKDRQTLLARAETLLVLGHVLREEADYLASSRRFEEALALRRSFFGPDAPEVAECWNGLGLLHLSEGRLDQAAAEFRRAMEIFRGAKNRRPLDLAEALSHLATVELDRDRLAVAAPLFAEARELRRRELGDDHPLTAEDLASLGRIFYSQGRYATAERLLREALDLRRRLLPPDHPEIASSWSDLGAAQMALGKLAAAEASHRAAVALDRRAAGGHSPHLPTALNNLAATLQSEGRPEEAAPLFEEALGALRALYGPKHPNVAIGLNQLALARRDLGDLESAERLAREALAIRRKAPETPPLDLANSLITLGTMVERRGALFEAERDYREALAIRERLLPPDHVDLATPRMGLGNVLVARGKPRLAEPLLRQALAIRTAGLPAGHIAIALAQNALGACLAELGAQDEARPLLTASLERIRTLRGAEHADTRRAEQRLRRLALLAAHATPPREVDR